MTFKYNPIGACRDEDGGIKTSERCIPWTRDVHQEWKFMVFAKFITKNQTENDGVILATSWTQYGIVV